MAYIDYKNARDAAWKILIECEIKKLPVRPSAVCKHFGWILSDYQNARQAIELLGLTNLPLKTDGFCTITSQHTYIFFDGALPEGRQRFTVAHEIGHLILGHVRPGIPTTENREPAGSERPEERQANQFAARLLAPSCVLHEIGAVQSYYIQSLCGLSHQAAEVRASRMQELERRGKYYTSPLERQVVRQFSSYIALVRGR